MSIVTLRDRAFSCLQRGREEHDDAVNAEASGHTPSKIISQCHTAAEYFLKAILYSRGIRIKKTHEVHDVATKWRRLLDDIWHELKPLLKEYDWLYPARIVADYPHADAPLSHLHQGISEPSVSRADVRRALDAAGQFRDLAERTVK
jgi:HEPN domain-containing protein